MSVKNHSKESVASEPLMVQQGRRPLLTVVVPVFNGGEDIIENVGVIRRRAGGGLDSEAVELVVVSDGSIDGTSERLMAARSDVSMRVIHYDRNLGKGYAVKVGAMAAGGDWVAVVDADLDLDPAAIPGFLDTARVKHLDFAIGSKRHPDSIVNYPRSRRVASWCYQQLNRVLFQLDVRDTQVGLKVFRREVADNVVPLLLVKQFAFDLELLAVAHALGFRRVEELPVRLDYRFSGSAVRSRAVARALWDTAAVFYRLRILRTYQRKRSMLASAGGELGTPPLVDVIADEDAVQRLDYPRLEMASSGDVASRATQGDIVAILEPGARPAGNWVSAAIPFFAGSDVAAVVVPTIAPTHIPTRQAVAAAVLESRLGGGSRRSRHLPGNVRVVADHPAETVIVRRRDYLTALDHGVDQERLVSWLAERGRTTVYTPDASVSAPPPPLLGPHLRGTVSHSRARGVAARRSRGATLSIGTGISIASLVVALGSCALLLVGGVWGRVGSVVLVIYLAVLVGNAILAALHFRSVAVGLLAPFAVVATQVAYAAGFVWGLVTGRR